MITQYYTPTKVLFGKGAYLEAGRLLKELNQHRVLIHYGSASAVKSGLLKAVEDNLMEAGIDYELLGGVKPNPRLSLVREGIELCMRKNIGFILAVGGGSVIDSAKAIGYGLYNGGDVWDFYSKKRTPKGCAPVGVILTLSATGSEMSDSSVITNEDGGLKRGCNSDFSRPVFSLLDPELTYSVSPYQTSCGTADIMMHTIERFFHSGESLDITDSEALALVKQAMASGLAALKDPRDYQARASLMWAGALSHNGLMNVGYGQRGDWACHQMEHELSGMFDVAHGAGLSAIWSTWARYVYKENPSRFVLFGERLFGIERTGDDEKDAEKAIDAMEGFFRSMNLPVRISELGVDLSEENLDELTEKATFFGTRTLGAFRVLEREDIRNIYALAK